MTSEVLKFTKVKIKDEPLVEQKEGKSRILGWDKDRTERFKRR